MHYGKSLLICMLLRISKGLIATLSNIPVFDHQNNAQIKEKDCRQKRL